VFCEVFFSKKPKCFAGDGASKRVATKGAAVFAGAEEAEHIVIGNDG
jgi:hypothetical protein